MAAVQSIVLITTVIFVIIMLVVLLVLYYKAKWPYTFIITVADAPNCSIVYE